MNDIKAENPSGDSFRTMQLVLHKYKLEALERLLDGEDVEELMQEQLNELYSDTVPYALQQQIRMRIDAEHDRQTGSPVRNTNEVIREALESDRHIEFHQPLTVPIRMGMTKPCADFREYAEAIQYPTPAQINIPENTQNLLTALINNGDITVWQAYDLRGEYEFDESETESLSWPEPPEILSELGFTEMAHLFDKDTPVVEWGQQM